MPDHPPPFLLHLVEQTDGTVIRFGPPADRVRVVDATWPSGLTSGVRSSQSHLAPS